jgi:hypothetical protein
VGLSPQAEHLGLILHHSIRPEALKMEHYPHRLDLNRLVEPDHPDCPTHLIRMGGHLAAFRLLQDLSHRGESKVQG